MTSHPLPALSGPRTEGIPLRHGAIGNGRVLALVSPTSSIDWLCLPRFDSPFVFGRLLDDDLGGRFLFTCGGHEIDGELAYVTNTNVLRTRFERGDDAWEVIDFAPRLLEGLTARTPAEIVRIVRPLRGLPSIGIQFDPRPDYGRIRPTLVHDDAGITVEGGGLGLRLLTNAPASYVLSGAPILLREPLHFVLTQSRSVMPTPTDVQHELDLTIEGWRAWSKTCALPLYRPEAVLRSALCLKLHAFVDTGAVIAAATTSIPEALHTQRTWDYRYCWLRDAAFVVEALRRLSHLREGEQFLGFLLDAASGGPLQPLYGVTGERTVPESVLTHLAGYDGTSPVRIGNAAAGQIQNDLVGELVLCVETLLTDPRLVHDDPQRYRGFVRHLVEEAIRVAPLLDTGIWEFRTLLRPYTFSRAMCWVALQRGARLARRFGWHDEASRWETIAASEREIVLARGYDAARGYFTQSLGGVHPDASLLLLPTIGIIDPHDPRFASTVDACERLLAVNGLMLRYRHPDDFGETESAFTICSFWWAEALALMGRLEDAIEVFERVVTHANGVGLFSEDIDPSTGRLLGNFPQAYTHVGLIHAAMTIGKLLDARDGRVRAWT